MLLLTSKSVTLQQKATNESSGLKSLSRYCKTKNFNGYITVHTSDVMGAGTIIIAGALFSIAL
jgi:hypothetical protein